MTFLQTLTQKLYQKIQEENQPLPSAITYLWNDSEAERLGQLKLIIDTPKLLKVSQLQAQKRYPKAQPTPFILNPTEQDSWQWLNEQGAQLSNPFTLKQIKKAKLKLAKKLHPDQGGAPQQFILLLKHINQLSQYSKFTEISLENKN